MTNGSEERSDALRHDHRRARRPQASVRLTRASGAVAGGVAAGVAEFVSADPRAVRWLWIVSLPLSGGLTAVAYLVLWVLLPGPGIEPAEEAGA